MDTFIRDLRYALRSLTRKPGFTLVAVLSLGIGIGANTAVFTLANAVILRDLPLENPAELADVYKRMEGFSHSTVSYPDLVDLRERTTDIFAEVGGYRLAFVQGEAADGVEILPAELVSGTYFPMLGVAAAAGRTLQAEDDVSPGGHYVVMLGYAYWQSRYAGDPSIVGRSVQLNGRSYTVVGVAPQTYTGSIRGLEPSLYAPMMMVGHLNSSPSELESRGSQSIFAKARLAPGVTFAQVDAVLQRISADMRTEYPDFWRQDNGLLAVPTADVIMNPMIDRVLRPATGMLVVVMGLVLLIACANLASFLLARASDRRKEVAVRMALGARRAQLVRQLLTESILLALVGGAAGLALSIGMLKALVGADLPLPFPLSLDLGLDLRVLGFALAVSMFAGILFGMVPALQATNPDVAPTLKDESTGGGRPRRITLRGALVSGQVAMSILLLVSAGLFLRSLQARLDVDPGFGYQPAALVTLQLPGEGYSEEEIRVFYDQLLDDVRQLPGVVAVGMTVDMPLNTLTNEMTGLNVDGVDPPAGDEFFMVDMTASDPGFFQAAGIEIVRGREFGVDDNEAGAPAMIVSEAFAERFWPGEDPLGRTVRSGRGEAEYTVVGVAKDVKIRSLGESPRPFVYRPFGQASRSGMTLVAKTAGDPTAVVRSIGELARALEPEVLTYEQKTMERHLAVMLLPHRLGAVVISAFGLIALLLAAIGLYGVVSYAVASRNREVGIRMALGANRSSVVRMMMRGGLRLVVVGGVAGLVLSALGARLMSGLLYGVASFDPVTFALVPLVLFAVATLAAWVPARRASRVDPVRSLRSG